MTNGNPTLTVVGARGVVGRTMLELLQRESLSDQVPLLYGSVRSRGKTIAYRGAELPVRVLGEHPITPCDVAQFSCGSGVAREWAARFLEVGAAVVDNSSAFRMDPGVPLVVPEINGDRIPATPGIIANPNCSTIILLMAIQRLRELGRFRVVADTYQAVSGAGQEGLVALERELGGGEFVADAPFAFPIARNLIPLIGDLDDADGVTTEERKMQDESRKILDIPDLEVFTTCVRVPVTRCHSEAVTLFFDAPVDLSAALRLLDDSPGLELEADPTRPPLPTEVAGGDPVRVGRVRTPAPGVLQMWVVGDQVLKGAALNAVQIARRYLDA